MEYTHIVTQVLWNPWPAQHVVRHHTVGMMFGQTFPTRGAHRTPFSKAPEYTLFGTGTGT